MYYDDDDGLDYEERYDFSRRRSRYNADNENCTFRILKLLWSQKNKGLLSPSQIHDLRILQKEFNKTKDDSLRYNRNKYGGRGIFKPKWDNVKRKNAWNDLKNRSTGTDSFYGKIFFAGGPYTNGYGYNYCITPRKIFVMILEKMEEHNHKS